MKADEAQVRHVEQVLDGLQVRPALDVALAPLARPLAMYVALLERWNARFDLTGFRDRASMSTGGVGQSLGALAVWPELPAGDAPGVLDVGSGAGFPGIPLALARPGCAWTLLEPRRKRASFLREVCLQLDLHHVTVRQQRLEREPPRGYPVVTSRAVGGIGSLVPRVLQPGGCWIVASPATVQTPPPPAPDGPTGSFQLEARATVRSGPHEVSWLRWRWIADPQAMAKMRR